MKQSVHGSLKAHAIFEQIVPKKDRLPHTSSHFKGLAKTLVVGLKASKIC